MPVHNFFIFSLKKNKNHVYYMHKVEKFFTYMLVK